MEAENLESNKSKSDKSHEVIREILPKFSSIGAIELSQAEVLACYEI